MRKRITRFGFLILLAISVFGGWVAVSPAFAAPRNVCAGCNVVSVEPTVIVNSVENTITIRGNFGTTATPVVILDGFGALDTTKVNDTTLTAVVPTTIPGSQNGKDYPVTVLDDDGDDITGSGSLILTVKKPGVPQPTEIPLGTSTPEPTAYIRPLVVVLNYGISQIGAVRPGQTFAIEVNLINTGQIAATNVVVTFFPGDFEPRETGGIRSEGTLQPGQTAKIVQTLTAKPDLETGLGLLDIEIRYTDEFGTAYSDKARIAIDVLAPTQTGGSGPGATRTPTPGALNRPQFVITGYTTDVETLQPGTQFTLQLDVVNRGTETAKAVSMIVGGGSSSGGDGTPGAGGGVSGGSGEFTNFSPINSSNVQFVGDVPAAGTLVATQQLIVNSNTAPGAYSLKISFVYTDTQGASYTDDQVITLLVLKPPRIDISFYTPAGPLFAGQPGPLPIQVVNLGNASTVLGLMTVTADGADVMNNTLLVGNVDPGFPVTLDAQAIPFEVGTLTVHVVIEYIDDFNQTRTIEKDLTVDVIEGFPEEPGIGEPGTGEGEGGFPGEIPAEPETVWQLIMRFFRGLLGLGSERSQPDGGGFEGGEGFPPEEFPTDGGGGGEIIVPVPGKGP
jgi:hypothetical protein